MSSALYLITTREPIPTNLTPLQLVLWSTNYVNKDEFGSFFYDKRFNDTPTVYINDYNHYYVNSEWSEDIDTLLRKSQDSVVLVPKELMIKLWNNITIAIDHSSKGQFTTKEQWIAFVNETDFKINR